MGVEINLNHIMQAKSRKELIERALGRMVIGDEDQISLAVIDFKKARDVKSENGDLDPRMIEMYESMAEILLGIESSKQSLSQLVVGGLSINYSSKVDRLNKDDIVSLNSDSKKLLEDQVSKNWIKSLKYDAIIKALEDSDSAELKDNERLAKVLEITGKKKMKDR